MQNLTEFEKQQLQTLKTLMAQMAVPPPQFLAGASNVPQLLREYQDRFESV